MEKTDPGMRRYLYEYVVHEAIDEARRISGQTVPVSVGRAVRDRVGELVDLSDPGLKVTPLLSAITTALGEQVPGHDSLFEVGSARDPLYRSIQDRFMERVFDGLGSHSLPLSPYDPRWRSRSSVMAAGAGYAWIDDESVGRYVGHRVDTLDSEQAADVPVWHRPRRGDPESGPAYSDEDAAGLSELAPRMSAEEYRKIHDWVLDGARDRRTGRVERSRFMTGAALARSTAILDDLAARGIGYEISPDRRPGQIRARLTGTRIEVRLTDSRAAERYAGARVYDDGTQYYYTSQGVPNNTATITPTPAQAVDLVRYAQGLPVARTDRPELAVGQVGATHPEEHWDRATRTRRTDTVPDVYHDGSVRTLMAAVDDHGNGGGRAQRPGKVALRVDARNHALPERFADAAEAEEFLDRAVTSARQSYLSQLDVEGLIEAFESQSDLDPAEITEPGFTGDPEIAAVRRSYWEVLSGRRDTLLRPGVPAELLDERLGAIGTDADADLGNLVIGGEPADIVRDHAAELADGLIGTLEPQARVPAPGAEPVDQRFDPVRVGRYMTSAKGPSGTLDDLVAACRAAGIGAGELMGTGFSVDRFKDRLVVLDEDSAVDITTHPSPFMRRIGTTVAGAITRTGARPGTIRVDGNGVISWSAERMSRDGSATSVSGTIGQILVPGEHGEIVTRLASGDDALIVPGYRARIAAQRPGERRSVEERTVLEGYEQTMSAEIAHRIGQDLLSGRGEVGEPASLNRVYSGLYGTRHPVDYLETHRLEGPVDRAATERVRREEAIGTLDPEERSALLASIGEMDGRGGEILDPGSIVRAWVEDPDTAVEALLGADAGASVRTRLAGMLQVVADAAEPYIDDSITVREPGELDPWAAAVLDTEARRIRYDTELVEGSSVYAEYAAARDRGADRLDDLHFDARRLTGGRNMAVLTGPDENGVRGPEGYLDPVMTVNNAHQGAVRYLVAGAQVDPDGRIVPGDPDTPEGRRAPLMLRPELATMDHDAFDRQLMTASNLMTSSEVTEPEDTALMTFGGWGADDGIVVSREFAERHSIIGIDGARRDLVVGDKLSDLHGNKGVIGLIVDRTMSPADAEAAGLADEVAWFAANPQLDVVMSPFSLISRDNAGAGRELIDAMAAEREPASVPLTDLQPGDTVMIEGSVGEGEGVVLARDDERGVLRIGDPDDVTREGLAEEFEVDLGAVESSSEPYLRSLDDEYRDIYGGSRSLDRQAQIAHDAEQRAIASEMAERQTEIRLDADLGPDERQAALERAQNRAEIRASFSDARFERIGSGRGAVLTGPDGRTREDVGVAPMRFIVTHMAVDEKTQVYDDEALLAGRGRRASSQLAWALESAGCDAVMREFYGSNAAAEADLREYLLAVGLDMDADGTLRVLGTDSPAAHDGVDVADARPPRRLFEEPDLTAPDGTRIGAREMRARFADELSRAGGDMPLPFPLRLPSGATTSVVDGPGFDGRPTWRLPVLSSHLRAGLQFDDGSVSVHDYTRHYLDILADAVAYRRASGELAAGDQSLPPARVERLEAAMKDAELAAQHSYDAITADLDERVFSGKRNVVRAGLMANRLPDSATAVWTADPRLDIDQVAMGPVMARELGLREGSTALVWRDPILRDSGVRAMRVAIRDDLTGVAINPVSDRSFDGDFDGDSVAVVALHTPEAVAQATERLSVPANLVDRGSVDDDGNHPLSTQVSLDTRVALSRDPELADEFDSAAREANRLERARAEADDPAPWETPGSEAAADLEASRADLTGQLSDLYRTAQRHEFGSALSFSDEAGHLASIQRVCVDTGAKGSPAKLKAYARALGDENGTGLTRDDLEQAMYATAVKAQGTGLGGSYSQRAVRALRDKDLSAVLELTYPVTQSILQVKHNALEAREKYGALQGPGRDLWRGRLIDRGQHGWQAVRDPRTHEPVQATRDQWVARAADFYAAPDGFNVRVDPACIGRVADQLADPATGRMRNLEEDESLSGSLMDRMAYGGDLETVVEAARAGQNLFDGPGAELFASASTRRARAASAAEMAALADGRSYDGPVPEVGVGVTAPDVIAPGSRGAAERGANRRSRDAVTVDLPRTRVPAADEVAEQDIDEPDPAVDYEMEI